MEVTSAKWTRLWCLELRTFGCKIGRSPLSSGGNSRSDKIDSGPLARAGGLLVSISELRQTTQEIIELIADGKVFTGPLNTGKAGAWFEPYAFENGESFRLGDVAF